MFTIWYRKRKMYLIKYEHIFLIHFVRKLHNVIYELRVLSGIEQTAPDRHSSRLSLLTYTTVKYLIFYDCIR